MNFVQRFTAALVFLVIGVIWADLHFIIAILEGRWWNTIPLVGMIIAAYGLGWMFQFVYKYRNELPQISNLFSNIATMLHVAIQTGHGEQFYMRMTLPPDEFERQLRQG